MTLKIMANQRVFVLLLMPCPSSLGLAMVATDETPEIYLRLVLECYRKWYGRESSLGTTS
jgi:hypothetical protein